MEKYTYQFPEQDAFRAMEATDPNFAIELQPDWRDTLWVDFNPIRSAGIFSKLNVHLGMRGNRLERSPQNYVQAVFSGHRGSGKSVELRRYAQEIDHKDAFFAVLVDLEAETNIEQIEAEDIIVAIIILLLRKLEARGVKFEMDDFSAIASEWLSEEENEREIKTELGLVTEAHASIGWTFWKFFSVGGNLKGAFSRNNATTRTIRQKIAANSRPLISKLNAALVALKLALREQNQGKDIIFLIDGLEKANPKVYERLFLQDVQFLRSINAHMVSTVPIRTFYEIQSLGSIGNFKTVYQPMLRINDRSIELLKSLVYKRASKHLFASGVLKSCIEMSGGCPRTLVLLVNHSLNTALMHGREIVEKSHAEAVFLEEGNQRWRALNQRHRDILKAGAFDAADAEVLDLLQSLSILEYNGSHPERLVNPLIKGMLKG